MKKIHHIDICENRLYSGKAFYFSDITVQHRDGGTGGMGVRHAGFRVFDSQ